MTDLGSVGKRLGDIFDPHERPVDPELPSEIADRIRDLIRAGDLDAAAELGRTALEELGVDPGPATRQEGGNQS